MPGAAVVVARDGARRAYDPFATKVMSCDRININYVSSRESAEKSDRNGKNRLEHRMEREAIWDVDISQIRQSSFSSSSAFTLALRFSTA